MLFLRLWVAGIDDTHYIMGSALGPAPFPEIVRDFQSVIGREVKRQYAEISGGKLPDLCNGLYRWWFKCYRYVLPIC